MTSFFRLNTLPFAAVLLALLLCVPLLSSHTQAATAVHKAPPAVSSAPDPDTPFLNAGLVDLQRMNAGLVFDIRYATTNNFTGHVLYGAARTFLRAETARKLAAANQEFMTMGYRIKIFDAYRPYSVQLVLYAHVSGWQKGFIANPYKYGSNHNRAAAVDITLVHLDGSAVEMPTDFDDFTGHGSIYYEGGTEASRENRELLRRVMKKHGFRGIACEWWHFDDTDAGSYGLLDIPLNPVRQ